jgi:hypothetical protein
LSTGNFLSKSKVKTKIKMILEGFDLLSGWKKEQFFFQICIFGFQCVAKHILKVDLRFVILSWFIAQIWLNNFLGRLPFFDNIFIWMITT